MCHVRTTVWVTRCSKDISQGLSSLIWREVQEKATSCPSLQLPALNKIEGGSVGVGLYELLDIQEGWNSTNRAVQSRRMETVQVLLIIFFVSI